MIKYYAVAAFGFCVGLVFVNTNLKLGLSITLSCGLAQIPGEKSYLQCFFRLLPLIICFKIVIDGRNMRSTDHAFDRALANNLSFKALVLTMFFMFYIGMRGVLGLALISFDSYEEAVGDDTFILIRGFAKLSERTVVMILIILIPFEDKQWLRCIEFIKSIIYCCRKNRGQVDNMKLNEHFLSTSSQYELFNLVEMQGISSILYAVNERIKENGQRARVIRIQQQDVPESLRYITYDGQEIIVDCICEELFRVLRTEQLNIRSHYLSDSLLLKANSNELSNFHLTNGTGVFITSNGKFSLQVTLDENQQLFKGLNRDKIERYTEYMTQCSLLSKIIGIYHIKAVGKRFLVILSVNKDSADEGMQDTGRVDLSSQPANERVINLTREQRTKLLSQLDKDLQFITDMQWECGAELYYKYDNGLEEEVLDQEKQMNSDEEKRGRHSSWSNNLEQQELNFFGYFSDSAEKEVGARLSINIDIMNPNKEQVMSENQQPQIRDDEYFNVNLIQRENEQCSSIRKFVLDHFK
ncbi:hypothetical protein FGO68_gene14512 [Halteria grandinella]|uniref:Uncharacterized protein n=1 Tax=Halteria grandinella TaxID=5974 RepID=A0A8J8NVH9_HALGN|nr:hypothetical protein FGO68_gene14512 [Halteria grandinella]